MTPDTAQLHLFDMLAWRLARGLPGMRQGMHRARMAGAGDIFADVAPLLAHPDPRRLDLRRSLTDPFGTIFVRRFQTRTDLRLHVMIDASASLAAGAGADRIGLAALLAAGFAQAARRGQDLFSLDVIGGDALLHTQAPSRRADLAAGLLSDVPQLSPQGRGIDGLCRIATDLPVDRILIVLISDFEFLPTELDHLLASLRPRPVLPIWLRDTGIENPPPRFGLAELRDPETGRRRTVLTTPAWARAQARSAATRRLALEGIFAAHGLNPVQIRDSIDVAELAAALDEAAL